MAECVGHRQSRKEITTMASGDGEKFMETELTVLGQLALEPGADVGRTWQDCLTLIRHVRGWPKSAYARLMLQTLLHDLEEDAEGEDEDLTRAGEQFAAYYLAGTDRGH